MDNYFEGKVFALNNSHFEDQNLKDKNYVGYVLFYAQWCSACKNLKPTIEVTSKNVPICAVDCTEKSEENQNMIKTMDLKFFPSLFVYKNGKKIGLYEGEKSPEKLSEYIKQYYNDKEPKKEEKTPYFKFFIIILICVLIFFGFYRMYKAY